MSRNISAIYYQENKQKLHKKLIKDIKFFLRKKKKKKSDNMVAIITKIFQKIKIKNFLRIEKNVIE